MLFRSDPAHVPQPADVRAGAWPRAPDRCPPPLLPRQPKLLPDLHLSPGEATHGTVRLARPGGRTPAPSAPCPPEPHVPDPPPPRPPPRRQPDRTSSPPTPVTRRAVGTVDARGATETVEAGVSSGAGTVAEVGTPEPAPRRRALSPLNPPLVALATTVLFLLGLLAYVVMSSDASAPPADDRPQLTEVAPIALHGD